MEPVSDEILYTALLSYTFLIGYRIIGSFQCLSLYHDQRRTQRRNTLLCITSVAMPSSFGAWVCIGMAGLLS